MVGTNLRPMLLACAVFTCPPVFAQTATYDFTGTVTSASGDYGSVDGTTPDTVTGTLTIDVGAAASGSVGLYGSSSGEIVGSTSPSIPFVYSSTVMVGGFSFSSYDPTGALSTEQANYSNGATDSYLNLVPVSGQSVYQSNGLLNPAGVSLGPDAFTYGQFTTNTNLLPDAGSVTYDITTLTPVPLPPNLVLMLSGIVFVSWLTLRHRRALTAAND
jgi:hypothetical protein